MFSREAGSPSWLPLEREAIMGNRLAYVFAALSLFLVAPAPAHAAESADENAEIAEDGLDLAAQPARRICAQPIVTGPCRAAFRRYAFNAAVGRCVPFLYGGCQGNTNNFETMRACQRTCYRRGPFRMP
jgi:hypothetical protein